MTREEKDTIILNLYNKRLDFLKGNISEEDYYNYISCDTVDKLSSNKKGYKDLEAKDKATKNFINKYFRSIPSLENIDKMKELKELENEYNIKLKLKDTEKINKLKEEIYNNYINYRKGIGSTLEENESIFKDILDNFKYKDVDPKSKITKKNALSTRIKFFDKYAMEYYTKVLNHKRCEYVEYINDLEDKKTIKYLKKERVEEDKEEILREKVYTSYIKYLNDQVDVTYLINLLRDDLNRYSHSDEGFNTSTKLLKAIEKVAYKYADSNNTSELLDYLKCNGPLISRLKREGIIPLYSQREINIIRDIYNNFIDYYNLNISYLEYKEKEIKYTELINKNYNISNKKKSKDLINYYIKNILINKTNINNIINNSKLYEECFKILKNFSIGVVSDNTKEFIDKYRANIHDYAKLYAKYNDLEDEYNNIIKLNKEIISGNNIINIKDIDYKNVIDDFINTSNLDINDYLYINNIDNDSFKKYIRYIKNNDYNLYIKYSASIIRKRVKVDKYYKNRINNLYYLIINGYEDNTFTLLDFYIYSDKFLYNIDRLIYLCKLYLKDNYNNKIFKEFINNISNEKIIDKSLLYDLKINYKGEYIDSEDKKFVINYLEKNEYPLKLSLFRETMIRYLDNNLSKMEENIKKLRDLDVKDFKNIMKYDNISTDLIPRLGNEYVVEEFKIIKTNLSYKVMGINNKDIDIINIDEELLDKLFNNIKKKYHIIYELGDTTNKLELLTKYSSVDSDNNYKCDLCGKKSSNSREFNIKYILGNKTKNLYNTSCLCKDCYNNFNKFDYKDRIKLITNIRDRFNSKFNNYLDSFDQYLFKDNFDMLRDFLDNSDLV